MVIEGGQHDGLEVFTQCHYETLLSTDAVKTRAEENHSAVVDRVPVVEDASPDLANFKDNTMLLSECC